MKKLALSVSALAFAATLGVAVPAVAADRSEGSSITAGGGQEVVEKKKRKKARKGSGAGSGSGSGSGR